MKIALCQINPIIGDIEGNKKKIIEGYFKSIEDKVDLVIFPELAICGYPPLDLVEKQEFRNKINAAAKEIASKTTDVGLIFGSILMEKYSLFNTKPFYRITMYSTKSGILKLRKKISFSNLKVKNLLYLFAKISGTMTIIGNTEGTISTRYNVRLTKAQAF